MQASVYDKPRILSALPRTLHLESGIVGKSRLSCADDCAAFFDAFILAVYLFGISFRMKYKIFAPFCNYLICQTRRYRINQNRTVGFARLVIAQNNKRESFAFIFGVTCQRIYISYRTCFS